MADTRPIPQALAVPQSLLDNFNAARPVCMFYTRRGGCKKGAKCPQRHKGDPSNENRVSFMSFAVNKEGELKCSVRPPICDMWQLLFATKGKQRKVLRLHRSTIQVQALNTCKMQYNINYLYFVAIFGLLGAYLHILV